MIHFLGDFFVDEVPNCKLSKSELVTLVYLIAKKSAYLTEIVNILGTANLYDESYARKILKKLPEKLGNQVRILSSGRSKVKIELSTNADFEIIENTIEAIHDGRLDYQKGVMEIVELYKGDLLPFLDNPWIVSYRNLLKSLVFPVLSKSYADPDTPSHIKIRLLKILPELYSSTINIELFKLISEKFEVSLASTVFDLSDGLTAVKLRIKEPETLRQILDNVKKASLLGDTELLLLVDSEVAKEFLSVQRTK